LVTPAANTVAVPHIADTAGPVANTAVQGLNASGGTGQQSSPSVSCTPMYVGVPSMVAELDAIKVTHFLHHVT
jgi:hypothetical protein